MILHPEDLLAQLPGPRDERYISAFKHGAMEVELYAPRGHDPQTPHSRDEVYVVVSGNGEFVREGTRKSINAGDLLFVAKGETHRFENFSDDLVVWVVFFG
jgi:mannose-6-phosphate isomerase-like protein (cupin superfamily)